MKKIKRVLAFMLVIVITFGLSVTAFAENSNTANIDLILSNTNPNINEEFTVTFKVTNNTGFNAMGIQLTYNEDVVQFIGFETKYDEDLEEETLVSDFSGYTMAYNNSNGKVSMATTKDKTKTGTLFAARFKVIAEGNANISYTGEYMNSAANGTVSLIIEDSAAKTLNIFKTYHITYEGTNYTVTPAEGAISPVRSGESYSFTVALEDGYVKNENFAVKANNAVLTVNENGIYTIENIKADQVITVEGIVEDVPSEGYVVSLTQDAKGKVAEEIGQVNVVVNSEEYDRFNAFYAEITYDSEHLVLQTASNDNFKVEDNDGLVKIISYGEDKALGDAITLNFKVIAVKEEGINVNLNKAHVDVREHAVAYDAPEANYGDKDVTFIAGNYSVNLNAWFKGDSTVVAGEDYTFTALDKNYIYTVTALMGNEAVDVIDHQNGSFTIKNVCGNLVITAERTAKTFNVEVNGAQEGQVTFADKANYATDYHFNVQTLEGYNTDVKMTIGGEIYTGFAKENGNYKIPGVDIIGNIIINVENIASEYTWEFIGNRAGKASTNMTSLSFGDDFIFAVDQSEGCDYTITATMGNEAVTITESEDGIYVIEAVKGHLVITINKPAPFVPEIEIEEFVKVDEGAIVQIVTVSAKELPEDKILTYNDEPMYWSEKYESFVYLNFVTDLIAKDHENAIEVVDGERISVDYSGNVNASKSIDVNDAQLVYDIYNAKYTDFNTVSMYKFLCADMNGDKKIDVNDAAAIVNIITGRN